jgi:hypothetical protein
VFSDLLLNWSKKDGFRTKSKTYKTKLEGFFIWFQFGARFLRETTLFLMIRVISDADKGLIITYPAPMLIYDYLRENLGSDI